MNHKKAGYFFLLFLLLLKSPALTASQRSDSLVNELNKAIAQSAEYETGKLNRIQALKDILNKSTSPEPVEQYNLALKIFEEYKSFNYDSAFLYVNKLAELGNRLNDPVKIIRAKVSLSFILLSAGMFKETFESLNTIQIANAPDSIKAEYYTLLGRLHYDLADYDGDYYHTTLYLEKAKQAIDSALQLLPPSSFAYEYFNGLRNLKAENMAAAMQSLEALYKRNDLTLHQVALVTSTLSRIYTLNSQVQESTDLLIEAAIADIKSSTKETIALFNLADIFYKKGDLKNAAIYVQKANDDAVAYGARQRKAQINPLLQLVQNQKIITVEQQRKALLIFTILISFFLLVVIGFAIIIFRQVKKLKAARENLMQVNKQLAEANTEKETFNLRLQKSNARLLEADKIKEEYIGYFFNLDTELFLKIEKFKHAIDKKIVEDKLADIKFIVNKFNLTEEKEEVLKSFDKVFLKLFPDFVSIFNSLFKEEDQVKLKEGQLLNTELRIFALIRMGITENEKIAQILGYSVNTIYTYKTKIKNKSLVPNEAFEDKILQQVQVVTNETK
jgi:tetratricopeptide (TPR) repeat protein